MIFEILGVPEKFSNAPGETTPESSRAPLRNPTVEGPLSPVTPSVDAHAALLDMAQRDGWTALYDPTDPAMVTLDGSGNAIGLKDSLGRYPEADMYPDMTARPLVSAGALKASQSGWYAQNTPVRDQTVIGLVKIQSGSLAVPFSHANASGQFASMAGLQAFGSAGANSFSTSDVGWDVLDFWVQDDVWTVYEFNTASGDVRVGGQRTVADSEAGSNRSSVGSRLLIGLDALNSGSVIHGPLLVMEGGIDDQARANAVDMLTRLSGAPVTNRIGGRTAEAYATTRTNGELVEAFRPDRPVQLASLTKVLTDYLARKVVTDAMLDQSIQATAQYVVEPTSRIPVVYPGDTFTWRTAFHLSMLVSHNQVTDTIAYHASVLLFGPVAGASITNPGPQIDRFVDHMNDYVQSQGWAEGVFTTPQGRGDSILTPRHFSELMHQVNAEDTWLRGVMNALTYDWSVTRINPVEDEPNPSTGTVTNIVRVNSGGQNLIELAGGKTGDTPAPAIRTVSVFWDDPVTGERLVSTALNTGAASADRYELLRQLFTAHKGRYGAPASWSSTDDRTQVEWRSQADGTDYASAFINPEATGSRLALEPFDAYNEPRPIVKSGNSISAGILLRSGNYPAGATMVLELEIVGGYFTDGSSIKRWSIGATTSWVPFTGSGVVKRGGVLQLRAVLEDGDGKTMLWARDASLTVATPEAVTYSYLMDAQDFQLSEDSQPLNPADSAGGVGDYSVTIKKPELGSTIFSEYGTRYLYGKRSRLTTEHGVVHGRIVDASEQSKTSIQVENQTEMGALNVQDVTAPPFTGTLGELITEYFALIAESAPEFTVDESLASLPITAPGWTGELWFHLKQLCQAYDMQLSFKQEGGVHFGPTPNGEVDVTDMVALDESGDPQRLAQFVEVVKYTTQRRTDTLIYPPDGWDDGVEVITVGPGETVVHTLELDTTVESFVEPTPTTYVKKDAVDASVYTIVDENGHTVPTSGFKANGGSISFKLSDDRKSITVRMTAPASYLRADGRTRITSYSLGSRFGDAGTQYSTLRIIGTGVHTSSEVLRIATGLGSGVTGTEVGATVDNPFVTSWGQAGRLGSRVAAAYAGFAPKISYDVPVSENGWGAGSTGVLMRGDRMDFRHRSSTYTPGNVSVVADYATAHQRFEGSVPNMSYADVDDWTDGLSYGDTANRGLRQATTPWVSYAWLGTPNNSVSIKKVGGVEVERNLVTNPSGETNTTGWTPTRTDGTFEVTDSYPQMAGRVGSRVFQYSAGLAGVSIHMNSAPMPVTAGQWGAFRTWVANDVDKCDVLMRILWLDSTGAVVTATPNTFLDASFYEGIIQTVSAQAPTGAVTAVARLTHQAITEAGARLWFDQARFMTGATQAEAESKVATYFDGSTQGHEQ